MKIRIQSTIYSSWKNLDVYVVVVMCVIVCSCVVDRVEATWSQNGISVSKALIRCEDESLEESPHAQVPSWASKSSSVKQLKISPLRLCSRYRLSIVLKLTDEVDDDRDNDPDAGVIVRVGQATEPILGNQVSFGQPLILRIQQGPVFQMYSLHYAFTVNAKADEEIYSHDKLSPELGSDCKNFDKHSPCGTESDASGNAVFHLGYCCPRTHSEENKSSSLTVHCYRESEYWYGVHELGPPQLFHQVYLQMYRLVEANATPGGPEWVKLGGKHEHGRDEADAGAIHIDSLTLSSYQEDIPNGDEYDVLTVSYVHGKNTTAELIKRPYLDSANQVLLLPIPPPSHFEPAPAVESKIKTHVDIPEALRSNTIDETALVVPRTLAGDHDGDVCDKIGVGPDAFLHQPDRCDSNRKEGTCLRNQPFDLWEQDSSSHLIRRHSRTNRNHKYKRTHKPRRPRHHHQSHSQSQHYRLRNFGPVHTSAPIKMIGNVLHLTMENDQEPTTSFVEIELVTKSLEPIQPDYGGEMILSVITDSKAEHGTLIVEVANKGHASGSYRVQVFDCPPLVPGTRHDGHPGYLRSKLKSVHAQRIQEFKFSVDYGHDGRAKLVQTTWCTLAVLNRHGEAIAMRQILVSPSDTCICYLNCECTCSRDAFRCTRLSKVDSIAAGIDDARILAEVDSESGFGPLLRQAKAYPALTVVIILLLLLFLGFLKAVLGLCLKSCCSCCDLDCTEQNFIGKLGLGFFYNRPRKLVHYYEKGYSNLAVVYADGIPVDPITRKPTVERLSKEELIAYNTILFVAWPCIFASWCMRRCCWTRGDGDDRERGRDRDRNRKSRERKSYQPLERQYSSDDLIEMDSMTAFKKGKSKSKQPDTSTKPPDQPVADFEIEVDEDGDEAIVHYSRPVSQSASQVPKEHHTRRISFEFDEDRDRDRDHEGESAEHRQYGLSFFMSEDGLGSGSGGGGSFAAGRKDSNMSMINVREDKSTEYMYRRTSAGQQEYAARLSRVGVGQPDSNTSTSTPNRATSSAQNLLSRINSWHRQPSDWSLRRGSFDNLGMAMKGDRS